ncbi:MAG: adventurous gliding motility protein GltC [Cystobacterineae bacterium]|nr:adventurous gliding motility protein GltC [Cystobacterineae bacterium]
MLHKYVAFVCLLVAFLGFSKAEAQTFQGMDSQPKSKAKTAPKKRVSSKGKAAPTPSVQDTAQAPTSRPEVAETPLPATPPPATPSPKTPPLKTPPPKASAVEGVKEPSGKGAKGGKGVDTSLLQVAINQFKAEDYEKASLTAFEIVRNPQMLPVATEAQYILAKALYRLGLYHSSLSQFSEILAKGPSTPYFKSALEWLFFIGRKTVNETVILDEIARYSNVEFPERFRSEFRYLLARYHFLRGKALDDIKETAEANGSFEEVVRLSLAVPEGDPYYARAKYLEGLAYYREGKLTQATEALKEVIRKTRMAQSSVDPSNRSFFTLRELAFMQLARIHYGLEQSRSAIFYYSKIERGREQWLNSLFESSWASYRIGRYEQALGNLITLSSPFFREEYFPEAFILRAVIYFENCRYQEALSIVDEFEAIYGPVQEKLAQMVSSNMSAGEYYQALDEIQKMNLKRQGSNTTNEILARVLNLALTDTDLRKTLEAIAELEKEVDAFSNYADTFKYSELVKALIESIKGQRERLMNKAGIMAKGKLELELLELRTLSSNALRIRVDTVEKEKIYLEQQLAEGGALDVIRKYQYSVAVPDDYLYWPYTGEYWRDELGTYRYTLTKGCINKPLTPAAEASDDS